MLTDLYFSRVVMSVSVDLLFLGRSVLLKSAPAAIYSVKFSFDAPDSPWRVLPYQHTRPRSGVTRPSIVKQILLGISHRRAGFNTPGPLASAPSCSAAVKLTSISSGAAKDAVRGLSFSKDAGALFMHAMDDWEGKRLPSVNSQDPALHQSMLSTMGDLGLTWGRCKTTIRRGRQGRTPQLKQRLGAPGGAGPAPHIHWKPDQRLSSEPVIQNSASRARDVSRNDPHQRLGCVMERKVHRLHLERIPTIHQESGTRTAAMPTPPQGAATPAPIVILSNHHAPAPFAKWVLPHSAVCVFKHAMEGCLVHGELFDGV